MEDGQAELRADATRERPRRRDRPRHVVRHERDERDDVGDADARVDTRVLAQVDQLDRSGDPGEQRLDDRLVVRREREHRAVVIGVRVDVQERDAASRRRRRSPRNDGRIPALGDVGHSLEHDPYPTKREAAALRPLWLGDNAILAIITGVSLGYGLLLVLAGSAMQLAPAGTRTSSLERSGTHLSAC